MQVRFVTVILSTEKRPVYFTSSLSLDMRIFMDEKTNWLHFANALRVINIWRVDC